MRKWILGGSLALLLAAVASGKPRKRQLVIVEEKKPALPALRPDWSGCGEPPDYCQPRPRFKCGDKVTVDLDGFDKTKAYTVNARTWGPIPDDPTRGLWVYGFAEASNYTEEANLTKAGG